MARLPWLIRTRRVTTKFVRSFKKINIWGNFLFYHEIVCCVYSLESTHRSDSNEYIQHTIIVSRIEKWIPKYSHLLPDLASLLTLIGSNYLYPKQISMVPKCFELLRFDWNCKLTGIGYIFRAFVSVKWHQSCVTTHIPVTVRQITFRCSSVCCKRVSVLA